MFSIESLLFLSVLDSTDSALNELSISMSNTLVAFEGSEKMRPICVPTDTIDFSLPSECLIIRQRVLVQLANKIQQNVVMWLSTGSYDSEITTLLDDGAQFHS